MFFSKNNQWNNQLKQQLIQQLCKNFGVLREVRPASSTFRSCNTKIEYTKHPKQKPVLDSSLIFGKQSTDHMLIIDHEQGSDWQNPLITEFQNLIIHPFNTSLHYAVQCFEGMKAYKDDKQRVRLFRPDANMNRFRASCDRMSLAEFEGSELLECIKQLLRVDRDWVPDKFGYSLYIRPTGIAWDSQLGVRATDKTRLFCVMSPVGPYYAQGFKPVSIYCESQKIRAAPGGPGGYKVGSNYGPTIKISEQAIKKGYQQVLWLFEDQVLEVGTSNVFFFIKNKDGQEEVITPSLDDMILPGVTRDSTIKILKDWNRFPVTERKIMIQELIELVESGRMIEAFSTGTAVTIGPIKQFSYKDKDYQIPIDQDLNAGKLSKELSDYIFDIQYGKIEHPFSVLVD